MRNDTTLFGERTSNIRQLAMNDPEYEKRKLSIVRRFFVVLRSRKSTAPLAEVVDDPNEPGTKLEHFYIACRGPRNTQKRKVFGQALLLFSSRLWLIKYKDVNVTTPSTFANTQY